MFFKLNGTAREGGKKMRTIVTSAKSKLISLFNGGVYTTIIFQALSAGVPAEQAHEIAKKAVDALKNADCYGPAPGTAMILSGEYSPHPKNSFLGTINYHSQSGNEYMFQGIGSENFLAVSYDEEKSSIADDLKKLHNPFFAEGLEGELLYPFP